MKVPNLLLLILSGTFLIFSSCKDQDDDPDPAPLGPIELACDHFQSDQTLTDDPDRAVDYYITCVMDVAADVVINPGVVIEFATDAGINVETTGSFKAMGSATQPISMTGENKSNGSWKGILYNSPSTNNQLEYVNLSYAGGAAFNSNGDMASVIVWGDSKLEMDHLTISNSGNYGISAIYTNSDWTISNSNVNGATNAPAIFLPPYLASLDGSNEFTGNTKDYLLIDLATQSIESDLTWKKASVPYRITSTYTFFDELVIDNAIVTMEAGVKVLFEQGNGMEVEDDATLIAIGTANEKIEFSGVSPTPGSWTAIYFNACTTVSNELTHVNISHAGGELDNSNGGILMRVNPILKVENTTFNDIAACSIFNKDVMLNPNLTTSDITHNNTQGTLCSD